MGLITAWHLWRQHRLGLSLIALWLLGLTLTLLIPKESIRSVIFALALLPFFFVYLYLIAMLSHGLSANLLGRRSCFPPWMLTLPVTSWSLACWPLVFGIAMLAGIWGFLEVVILQRFGASTAWWPALLLMVGLAGTQAALWTSFRAAGLRLVAFGILIPSMIAFPILKHSYQLSDTVVICGLLCVLVLACTLAHRGLSQARSESEPSPLSWGSLRLSSARSAERRTVRAFGSAEQAQLWLEWRLIGRSLSLFAILIPIYYAVVSSQANNFVRMMIVTKTLPVYPGLEASSMSTIWLLVYYFSLPAIWGAASLLGGGCFPSSKQASETSSFYASLPVSDVSYTQMKHRAVLRVTFIIWIIMLTLSGLWLTATGRYKAFVELRHSAFADESLFSVILLGLGVIVVGVTLTWVCFRTSRFLLLPGRRWILVLSILVAVVLAMVATSLAHQDGAFNPEGMRKARHVLGAVGIGLFLLKILLCFATIRALVRRGWLTTRSLVGALTVWVVLSFGCSWTLCECLGVGSLSTWLLGVSLIIPLNRSLAAPLALSWNRHR